MEAARQLLDGGRVRHGLYFAHLALEKILKAHVCRSSRDLAPKIHNLLRPAEESAVRLNPDQLDFLAEMNQFNIEGRYPETTAPPPTLEEARAFISRAEEIMQWLTSQL
ncbi:MAG: HEPN domain-containing protein [bacterium]